MNVGDMVKLPAWERRTKATTGIIEAIGECQWLRCSHEECVTVRVPMTVGSTTLNYEADDLIVAD